MKIVGVDPGVSTGLACFSSGYFIDGSVGMNYDEIEEYILSREPDIVVVEDYIARKGPNTYHPPIRVIGVVEWICSRNHIPMVIQSPSILRFTLDRVKHLHKSPHVRSASAHVVYYLSKRGIHAESNTGQTGPDDTGFTDSSRMP